VLSFLRRSAPGVGLVYFDRLPETEELRLRAEPWQGAEASPAPDSPALAELLRFSSAVTDAERRAAESASAAVLVRVPAAEQDVLRDRKQLLRALRGVMADDGAMAVDLGARLPWSQASLEDELSHDAALDVEALYCLHAVYEDSPERVTWLHTHGLAELGGFDVDVLRPGAPLLANMGDTMRVFAFAVIERTVTPTTDEFEFAAPNGRVRFVPAKEFMTKAAPDDAALRSAGAEEHIDDRAVLCDAGRKLFSRGDRPRPSRFLANPPRDGVALFFSDTATELSAERARQTLVVLRGMVDEFADLGLPTLIKLGYPRDDGEGREHLWFSVDRIDETSVEATLENRPYGVSGLRPGERGTHGLELVTDWTILTPFGSITPRSLVAARSIRERPDEVRALIEGAR
jgi:Protein of unknown function (DUF4026) C-terminal